MDDNGYYYDKEKFDAVWRRVIGAPDAGPDPAQTAPADEAARLRDFMDGEARDAQLYAALAGMSGGTARQTLYRLSRDEKDHLKSLRARYFILTGDTYAPPSSCPLVRGAACALRNQYADEGKGSEAYLKAAQGTLNEDLAETYGALGADEARHRKTLGRLIEALM